MKTFLTLVLATVLIGVNQSAQCQFQIKTDKDTVNINSGDSATIDIQFVVSTNFDASIYLSVESETLKSNSTNFILSNEIVNIPYTSQKLLIKIKEGFAKGIHKITIKGSSGNYSTTIDCYIQITNISRWHIYQLGVSGAPKYIFQDANGSYWCNKIADGGINLLTYKVKKEMASNFWFRSENVFPLVNETTTMAIDNINNKYYFGGKDRLTRYDGTYTTVFTTSSSPLPSNLITALATDNSGVVWIGTSKGLSSLDGNTWKTFTKSNSVLDSETITGIVISGSTVWIGTQNGLAKFDGTNWSRFTPQNSLIPAPFVWSMAVDINDDIWLGLGNGETKLSVYGGPENMIGLVKFDGITWQLYNNTNSPMNKDNYINAIAIDRLGNKWIATAGYYIPNGTQIKASGLLKYDNSNWVNYTPDNSPLPKNDISWVGLDYEDNVWFSSTGGFPMFWGVFNERGLPPFLSTPNAVSEQPAESDGIHLFPNPTSTQFTLSGVEGVASVRVVNSLGEEVRKWSEGQGTREIDVSNLANGLYFVSIRTVTGAVVKPIIVSH